MAQVVTAVDQDLPRSVWRERQLVDHYVGERDGVRDQRLRAVEGGGLAQHALEREPVVACLRERVLDSLGLAASLDRKPLAVPALDSAALDLEADDPRVGVAEDEVDLAELRPLAGIASDPGRRAEGLPFV